MRMIMGILSLLATWPAFAQQSTFQDDFDIQKAFCRQSFPSAAQQLAELQAATLADPTASTGVGGLKIQNENPSLIWAYRELVSYKNFDFSYKTDVDFWAVFKDDTCDKALCAAQTIFGNERGVLFLYLAWKYGIVASELGFDRLAPPTPADQTKFDAYYTVQAWTPESIAPFLTALPQLPAAQMPILGGWRFTRAGIVDPMNANVLSNALIQVYSPLESETPAHQEQTMFHELGHAVGAASLDHTPEWIAASGWALVDGKVINNKPDEFISEYAKKDLFEDFAESFVYYRYAPELLIKKSPARYDYLKKFVFGNREYRSQADCAAN